MKERAQLLPFQWSLNRFAGDLLPPRSGLFVAHDEVLVVDTGQMKVQHLAVYRCLPHQTGVTERSISRDDRRVSNHVLHQVMISHEPHRISDGFALVFNRQDHV